MTLSENSVTDLPGESKTMKTDQRLQEFLEYICQDIDRSKLKDYFTAIYSHTRHFFNNYRKHLNISEEDIIKSVKNYIQ